MHFQDFLPGLGHYSYVYNALHSIGFTYETHTWLIFTRAREEFLGDAEEVDNNSVSSG